MSKTFTEFVRLRRRWFFQLFSLSFLVGLIFVARRYDSAVEIVGLTLIVSLVITTLISLLSAPVVYLIARKRVVRKQDSKA